MVLAGRTVQGLESVRDKILADGGQALVHPTDILDSQSVQSLFAATKDEFGTFDVVINNAGITAHVNLVDLQEDDWQRVFDTNVRGMFLCSREAGRHFREMQSGRVVNVASVFGLLGRPGFSAYCASKGAVVNFTRAVAAEWARFGAQMNAVAPGYFATDINADLRKDDAAMAKVLRRIPAHRMGRPEELANIVELSRLPGAGLPHRSDDRRGRGRVECLTPVATMPETSSSVSRCVRQSAAMAAYSRT